MSHTGQYEDCKFILTGCHTLSSSHRNCISASLPPPALSAVEVSLFPFRSFTFKFRQNRQTLLQTRKDIGKSDQEKPKEQVNDTPGDRFQRLKVDYK